jgi:hypothetical protein
MGKSEACHASLTLSRGEDGRRPQTAPQPGVGESDSMSRFRYSKSRASTSRPSIWAARGAPAEPTAAPARLGGRDWQPRAGGLPWLLVAFRRPGVAPGSKPNRSVLLSTPEQTFRFCPTCDRPRPFASLDDRLYEWAESVRKRSSRRAWGRPNRPFRTRPSDPKRPRFGRNASIYVSIGSAPDTGEYASPGIAGAE